MDNRYSVVRFRPLFIVSVWLPILLVAGCGSADQFPPMALVAGTVLMDDKPVTHGTVTFYPDRTKGNNSLYQPSGVIDDSGRYRLITTSRDGAKEGAPLGWYRVAVSSAGPPSLTISPPDLSSIHTGAEKSRRLGKYESPKTSELQIEVTANAPAGAYDLKLNQ